MRHKTPKTTSIEKALMVLMAFSSHYDEMGTVELSQKLGFHPATVSRILRILTKMGFLQQNKKTRKFTFGPSTFDLGKTIFRSLPPNLLNIAIPYLVDLCEEVGETVVLETTSGKEMVVNYIAQGRRSLSIKPNIGDRIPMHVSPGAKAIIAFSDPERVDSLLSRKMERFTPHTITDRETFRSQLNRIRQRGVAFSREEMVLGVNTVGAPVFDNENRPVAAVIIAGLATRIEYDIESPMVVALKKAAHDISTGLLMSVDGK